MSYSAGQCGWAIEPQEPKWINERALEIRYKEFLSNIKQETRKAATDDVESLDYLFNKITEIMESALTLARQLHGDE